MHVTCSFGARLDDLFARVRSRGGEYSNEHVAAAITDTGISISQSYIWQLRKSKKDNPTLRHLQGLAWFFGVPVAYFFEDDVADRVNQQLEELRAEQERLSELAESDEARSIAMRAGELSEGRRQQVMDLLDVVYRLERSERGEIVDE